jgi:starch synthase
VPTRYEAVGHVAAEAMAMSVPVVGTETAGLSEVIAAGETGLLVPPDEPGAMADALLALLGDPARARAMGSRGSERARDCFSRERYEREILAVYGRLMEGRRAT